MDTEKKKEQEKKMIEALEKRMKSKPGTKDRYFVIPGLGVVLTVRGE